MNRVVVRSLEDTEPMRRGVSSRVREREAAAARDCRRWPGPLWRRQARLQRCSP